MLEDSKHKGQMLMACEEASLIKAKSLKTQAKEFGLDSVGYLQLL